MGQEVLHAVSEAEILKACEGLDRLLDEYVMVVTEGLCTLENENPQIMKQEQVHDRKTRILELLDTLDMLTANHRSGSTTDSPIRLVRVERHGA